jgi:hypothetical protein
MRVIPPPYFCKHQASRVRHKVITSSNALHLYLPKLLVLHPEFSERQYTKLEHHPAETSELDYIETTVEVLTNIKDPIPGCNCLKLG